MLEAEIRRVKHVKNYPAVFGKVQDTFLHTAAGVVEGDAKLLAPVKSGRLRDSITARVDGEQAIIGTNVEYAPYMEYGTKFTKARSYLRPSLDRNKEKLLGLFAQIFKRYFSGR